MSEPYIYQCTECARQFSAGEVESNAIYLCPDCGRAEKNRPLRGVLRIRYDYDSIRRKLPVKRFLQLPAGRFWLYPQLWPLTFDPSGHPAGTSLESLDRLALPENQLLNFELNGHRIRVLDDTRNPTYSYKDRATMLVALKALQLNIREISAASTGNAGSSLAGICARLGLRARIWVPQNIPDAKLLQIQSYGAAVHLVQGDYDTAFDLSLEIGRQQGWYNRNTAYNPLTIEGKKSAAFDLFMNTGGHLPKRIFVPVGDGVIIAGIYKGLWELRELGWIEHLPQLIAVQSKGSDALVRYLTTGTFEYRPAETLADSIAAGAPRNLYLAAAAVRETGGEAMAVSDREILNAQAIIARQMGILAEPAAAASLAGYLKFSSEHRIPEEAADSLLLLTGSGLKDISALQRWNKRPAALSAGQWRKEFSVK